MERHTYVYTTVFDDERQENAAIHAAAIMPLAASVPLCMKRQLYRYRHAAATAATHKRSHSCKHPVSIKRDCSAQARCMGGGARPRLCNASADAPRLSHTRCTPCGIMGVPISFGNPYMYSQILKGHVEQGHVLRRQGHTLREARLLLVPEPKQRIIHPQSRGRQQVLAPALCSQKMASLREKPARSHAPVRLAEW